MRRFELVREVDVTGVSGTGKVDEGVEFSNGWCTMVWLTMWTSIVSYPSIDHVKHIHGHNGSTKIVWLD